MRLTATIRVIDRASRRSVELPATLRYDGLPFDAEIRDLSVSGFRAKTSADLELGDRITVSWAGGGTRQAVVARHAPDGYGCFFVRELSEDVVLAAAATDTLVSMPVLKPRLKPDVKRIDVRLRLAIIIGIAVIGWAIVVAIGVVALVTLF